jgi:hypothetical protein
LFLGISLTFAISAFHSGFMRYACQKSRLHIGSMDSEIENYVRLHKDIRLTLFILILLTVFDLWYNRTKEVLSW